MWKEGKKGKKTIGKQKTKKLSHLLGNLILDATIVVLHY